jgi:hypothetical protein
MTHLQPTGATDSDNKRPAFGLHHPKGGAWLTRVALLTFVVVALSLVFLVKVVFYPSEDPFGPPAYAKIGFGMTEGQVIEQVGSQPGDYGDASYSGHLIVSFNEKPERSSKTLIWRGSEYVLIVYFDQNGLVNGKRHYHDGEGSSWPVYQLRRLFHMPRPQIVS